MKKIALTGNIAAGKSTVEKFISNLGYKILDADKICHDIYENDEEVIALIKKLFIEHDILDNNKLNRKKIAQIVFNDEKKLKELENIIHPAINKAIDNFLKENLNKKMIFVSIPLLFETKMEKNYDKIIFIAIDKKIQLTRLMQRNNLSYDEALARINSQERQEIKIKKSDYVIYNNASLEQLEQAVNNVISDLLNLF